MNDKILLGARILVVIGIIVMAGAVFIQTNNVTGFSTAQADLDALKLAAEEKYSLDKPIVPIDFSKHLVAPVKPAAAAAEEEVGLYEHRLKKYEEMMVAEVEVFKIAKATYKKDLAEYNYQMTLLNFKKVKENDSVQKQIKEQQKSLARLQIGVNQISLSLVFRFIGVILLLLGAAGMLLYADTMEKLGVLVMLGFAFKTIIGM